MRFITAVLLVIGSPAAFGAAPDTGWGTLLVGGVFFILASLTWLALWIGRAIFPMSTWKIAAVAAIPMVLLVILPILYGEASGWAHRAIERSWAHTSTSYIAASCHSTMTRPLTVSSEASLGILVGPSPKIKLTNNVTDSAADIDGVFVRSLTQFAYGKRADELDRERYQTPLMDLSFYSDGIWRHGQGIDYIETPESNHFIRLASEQYWVENASTIPPDQRAHLSWLKAPARTNSALAIRVQTPAATHLLSVADVSTTKDRQHWTARIHAKLTNRATGNIDAEYLGLIPVLPATQPETTSFRLCGQQEISAHRGAGLDWRSFIVSELVKKS